MESLLLPSSQSEAPKTSASTDQLIREWLWRFGVEHKEDVAPRLPLWLEAFGAMNAETLEKLFVRAFRVCKFFPKVSEILEPLRKAKEVAIPEAAQIAWERVLELRRTRWSPDAPGGFYGGAPQLSERVQSAARAAGVFKDYESADQLHVWAHKRFVESFIAWEELGQDKNLLPDGEIKNLLAGCATAKALPPSQVSFADLHKRGLEYGEQVKARTATIQRGVEEVLGIGRRKISSAPIREKSETELAEELRRQRAALVAHGWLPGEQVTQ